MLSDVRGKDIATAMGFALLAGMALAAILGGVPQARHDLVAAAGLLVDVSTFVLFLIEAGCVMLRPPPIAAAEELAPKAAALLGTWLMGLLVLLPATMVSPALSLVGAALGLLGDALAIAAMASLGRSFSVLPGARALVVRGPYRVVRHPVYLAQETALAGLVLAHLSIGAVALFAAQAACQIYRARCEERVLASAFPDFADYHRGTPMLLPRIDARLLGVAAASYAIALALGSRLLADPDTFLHVAAGRWIWAHGVVPSVDPFSASMAGAPWTPHEWLAELLFAGAFAGAGWGGVVALAALALAATFTVLAAALLRYLPARGAILLLAASFMSMAPHLSARPHVLAMPMLALWITGLSRARDLHRAPSPALLPVLVAWANLHGSFPVALFLGLAFAAEARLARERITGWMAFLAAAAAAPLISPLGFAAWQFPFMLERLHYSLGLVGEWQASDFSHFQPLELWLLGLPALALGGVRIPWLRLALLLLLLHLALAHARFADLVAIVAPVLLAPSLARFAAAGQPRGRVPLAAGVVIMAALTALGLAQQPEDHDPRIAPQAALAAAPLGAGPVFNDYDFGDYLIFSGVKPFVDGRLDLYGDAFMRRYMDALDAEGDALPALLAQNGIAWTILKPDRPAVALLDRLPGWRRAYSDAGAVVHVRVTAP
jgi:protein-S-isoprenylcysteine O-methyltransferase Ste14